MKDQFIAGLASETLRVKLIDKGHRHRDTSQTKVTLKEVVEVAKTFEATTYANKLMKTAGSNQEQVNYTSKPKTGSENAQRSSIPCHWCAGSHEQPRQQYCPAYGKRCTKCGIMGHFSRACKSRASHQRDHQQSNYVEREPSEEAFTMDGEKTARKFFAHLHLVHGGKTKVARAQIDSASTCNTMPEGVLRKLFPAATISKTKTRISTYGDQTLRPMGQVTLCCERKGKLHTLEFLVVDVPPGKLPLLSGRDALALHYLKIYADETHAVDVEGTDNKTATPLSPLRPGEITKEDVLERYSAVFKPGREKPLGSPLHIEMDSKVTPVHAPRHRAPVAKLDRVNDELKRLCDEGIIRPVMQPTEWLSNILVKKKPNGKLRICIDPSQTINRAIKRPIYSIPTIEEKLPLVTKAKVLTIVDVSEVFHTIVLDDESSLLTTFLGPNGHYCYTRMPFGISSGPEEYQRRQHGFLDGLQGIINIADDIYIFGCGDIKKEANIDHDRNLISLLDRCRDHDLQLSAKKLQFKVSSVTFMRHKLTDKGVEPDPSKVEAIKEMPRPADKVAVQRFLGTCQYLSKFCPNLPETVLPLRGLTKQDAVFLWSDTHENAFKSAKELITSATALRYYDPSAPVTLQVDASENAIGGVRLQDNQPVCFTLHTLDATERNYAQIEKECLAIVTCMNKWHQYLYGKSNITVHTDHQPLETIFKKPLSKAPRGLQRMVLKLQQYQFKVTYKKGKSSTLQTLCRARP